MKKGGGGVKQFNVQRAGADFEPLLAWSTDPTISAAALSGPDARDLLVIDEATDALKIVPQLSAETLLDRVAHSIYGRLADQVTAAWPSATAPTTPATYLLVDLAAMDHATVLATLGALVALMVAQHKDAAVSPARLNGMAGQAQCWLQQLGLSEHQLLLPAGVTVLRQLFHQLLDQDASCDAYVPLGCDTRAGKLAQDAVALTTGHLTALTLPPAWQLLRVAGTERQLHRD
ncbi:MAG: hypothetical protein LKH74_06625 [Levilactobacillus sp.]|jgi:hypothetical protein|uniref:hypothetical protein n=1 Tax=Levilactobacillus sp. TaxID=2767919 RepID=UPI00258F4D7C|nr:hypothetical protein [Levilactobacillus sp.]MCI1553587.1 hypothetical protein [Levilactobacillus sp.]MCI1599499.1 hypothetical protein [Levilactobacillus sp.]MCI1606356.1 hypothetical protein [Levilactobacillus sp.]